MQTTTYNLLSIILAAITLGALVWYALETMKIRKSGEAQLAQLRDVLHIEKLGVRPLIQWDFPFNDMHRGYMVGFKISPERVLNMILTPIQLGTTKYLTLTEDGGTPGRVVEPGSKMLVTASPLSNTQTLIHFELTYTTTKGETISDEYEWVTDAKPARRRPPKLIESAEPIHKLISDSGRKRDE